MNEQAKDYKFIKSRKFQSCGEIESTHEFEFMHELLCVILSIYEEDWRHP